MDIKKKYKNARAIIVLTATLIAMLLNIKYERDIIDSLIILIIVLIVFYAIASIAIKLIDKIRLMEPKTNVDSYKIPKINNNNDNNKIEETEEAK